MRLFAWLWKRKKLEHLHIVLYTRDGCCLCDAAADLLAAERQRHGFQLARIDIADDPDLNARYGQWIPVITVNGKERFRGIVNPVLLRRLLRGEERAAP